MMAFPWLSMVFHIILVSISWRQAAASESSEGMQGTVGTLSHRPRPLGGHLIKFDFPSILIEARSSTMAEEQFSPLQEALEHHDRGDGHIFFLDAGEQRIPSDTKHPETKKWGIY